MNHSKVTLDSRVRRCPVRIHERRHDGFCLRSRPRHPRSCALLWGQLMQRPLGLQVEQPCVQGSKFLQGPRL